MMYKKLMSIAPDVTVDNQAAFIEEGQIFHNILIGFDSVK